RSPTFAAAMSRPAAKARRSRRTCTHCASRIRHARASSSIWEASAMSRGWRRMDAGGRWAARGEPDPRLLRDLLRHPFLQRRPPKSTGREEFGEQFVNALLRRRRGRPEDLLATATLMTAMTIGGARRWLSGPVDDVIVGGGGVRNRTLMRNLSEVFAPTPVRTFDDLGYDSRAFEAVTFAVLAYQSVHGRPTNLPYVTGARRPVVLGTLTPGFAERRGRAAR